MQLGLYPAINRKSCNSSKPGVTQVHWIVWPFVEIGKKEYNRNTDFCLEAVAIDIINDKDNYY
jgi:hypothetical protein